MGNFTLAAETGEFAHQVVRIDAELAEQPESLSASTLSGRSGWAWSV